MWIEDEHLLDALSTPDITLPSQTRREHWHRDAALRRLMCAILTDAIRCYGATGL